MSPSPVPPYPKPGETPHTPVQVSSSITSDIAAEYEDFGGGVNPLGYKGHFFHNDGYGYSSSSPHESASPVSFKFSSSRRAALPVYDFGDDDEAVLSVVQTPRSALPQQEERSSSCTSLIGPARPFTEQLCIAQVGSSTVLSQPTYLAWRICFTLLTIATCIITVVQSLRFLAFIQGAAVVSAVFCQLMFLRRAYLYYAVQRDHAALTEKFAVFGWDAFAFQATLLLCVMVGPVLSINSLFIPSDAEVLVGVKYIGSISSYFLLAVTVLHLIDIFITPAPFRISHVAPVVLYTIILSAITMWSYARLFSFFPLILAGVIGTASGFLLHLLGRAVYIMHHEDKLACRNVGVTVEDPSQGKL